MTEWKKTDEAQDASDQKLSKILDAVMKSKLIPGPNRKQGQNFTKPEDYLAVALLVSRQELPQIEAMLEELVASQLHYLSTTKRSTNIAFSQGVSHYSARRGAQPLQDN